MYAKKKKSKRSGDVYEGALVHRSGLVYVVYSKGAEKHSLHSFFGAVKDLPYPFYFFIVS